VQIIKYRVASKDRHRGGNKLSRRNKRRASRWNKSIVARRTMSKRDENKNMMMYQKKGIAVEPKIS
jgi:hypothetical protein